jgi:hypothetical protein
MDNRILKLDRDWNILLPVIDTVNYLVVNILASVADDVAR